MNITRFAETLLIRDVLSYFIPGGLILLILIGFGFDGGLLQDVTDAVKIATGDIGAFFISASFGYIVGYLSSTAIFYIGSIFRLLYRPRTPKPTPEVLEGLKALFGDWVVSADQDRLAEICANYVEVKKPDYYYARIDRLLLLRNFEIGVASVLLTLSVSLFISLAEWEKLWGLLPFLGTALLILSSRIVHLDMLKQSFIAFYTIFSEAEHSKSSRPSTVTVSGAAESPDMARDKIEGSRKSNEWSALFILAHLIILSGFMVVAKVADCATKRIRMLHSDE